MQKQSRKGHTHGYLLYFFVFLHPEWPLNPYATFIHSHRLHIWGLQLNKLYIPWRLMTRILFLLKLVEISNSCGLWRTNAFDLYPAFLDNLSIHFPWMFCSWMLQKELNLNERYLRLNTLWCVIKLGSCKRRLAHYVFSFLFMIT